MAGTDKDCKKPHIVQSSTFCTKIKCGQEVCVNSVLTFNVSPDATDSQGCKSTNIQATYTDYESKDISATDYKQTTDFTNIKNKSILKNQFSKNPSQSACTSECKTFTPSACKAVNDLIQNTKNVFSSMFSLTNCEQPSTQNPLTEISEKPVK